MFVFILFIQFTNMIMKTTEESKKFSFKVMERKEKKKRRATDRLQNGKGQTKLKIVSLVKNSHIYYCLLLKLTIFFTLQIYFVQF